MHFIKNTPTAKITAINISDNPATQRATGVPEAVVDPETWRPFLYNLAETVVGADDKIYRYAINNNAIEKPNGEFETIHELVDRIRTNHSCVVTAGASRANGSVIKEATLSFDCGVAGLPSSGQGVFRGLVQITITSGTLDWNGRYSIYKGDIQAGSGLATIVTGAGTRTQVWDFGEADFRFLPSSGNYELWIFQSGTASFTLQGCSLEFPERIDLTQAYVLAQQNPVISARPAITDSARAFLADITWWQEIRGRVSQAVFDRKPAVGIGRYGAVQVQVSSETPFDSVALVNCECLEAEVDLRESCIVQGVDNTPSSGGANLVLNLTCIGNTPNTGTGLVDGVITLRSDTNMTWDGVAETDDPIFNPQDLVATRAPNDGANNAMVQRWIVKGQVFDFTRAGRIVIARAIGITNFTGSFEGRVYYGEGDTITLSPDAIHEASDLLFTDLQPIANDAGIYTATINIRADASAIPSQTNTTARPLASIGQVVIGNALAIGTTNVRSFNKELLPFSKIERSKEGDFIISPRPSTYKITVSANFDSIQGQSIARRLRTLSYGDPAVFITSGKTLDPVNYGTMLYGILLQSNTKFVEGNKSRSTANLVIEGLV